MARPVCAIATPDGRSAIGVIRLTGKDCLQQLGKIFAPRNKKTRLSEARARQAILGHIINAEEVVDEVIVIQFADGRSYTGEEAAEIHCHGNPLIMRQIIQLLLANGFALAGPGEFTRRAFLNQKLDLTESEAIANIIEARSQRELQAAFNLKSGRFRSELYRFRSHLLNLTADLSAELDFIDEDITFIEENQKLKIINQLIAQVDELIRQVETAERFKQGFQIAIIGAPNVGKSSLLNYFAGVERALVSDLAGTTRDFIESQVQLGGNLVSFIDTAGLRDLNAPAAVSKELQKHHEVERLGIKQTLAKSQEADVVLLLLDGSKDKETARAEAGEAPYNHLLTVVNKCDNQHSSWQSEDADLFVSVTDGKNLDELTQRITAIIEESLPATEGILLSAWQSDILQKLKSELANAMSLLEQNELPEIIVASLQYCVELIGQITGEITSDEVLGRIFSRFCIGK